MAWIPLALLIMILAVAAGGSYWVWQRFEFRQANQALRQREYEKALNTAERLLVFGPDKKRANEIKLLALLALDPDETQKLIRESEDKSSDAVQLAFLRQALSSKKFDGVDAAIEALGPTQGGNPDFLLLQAEIEIQRGNIAEANSVLDRLLTIDRNHNKAQLLKAKILLRSPMLATKIQAKSFLKQVGNANDENGKEALIIMALSPNMPLFENDRTWLLNRLRALRQPTPMTRLLAASQQAILEPELRNQIIAQAVAQNGVNEPQLTHDWLIAMGAYDLLLEFLKTPAASGIKTGARWQTELNALLQQGDLEAANALISSDELSIDDVRRATLLAHVQTSQKRTVQPNNAWLHALDLASQNLLYRELMSLGILAIQQGWSAQSAECFSKAFEAGQNTFEKIEALNYKIISLSQEGRTREALAVVEKSLELDPDDIMMENNLYYLRALIGESLPDDLANMRALVEQEPNSIIRSTYVFMLWQQGQYKEADAQFQLLGARYLTVPSCRLSGALISISTGNMERASQLLEGMQLSHFMPEEAALFTNAKAQLIQ